MKGSIRLFRIFGISINIHITFLFLLILVPQLGLRWLFLITAVFFLVTVHELCHSLVARRFGITVREITLLPIGGVASMTKMPEKPAQELAISLAGPLSNIAILIIFYYPLKLLLGQEVLFHPSTKTWAATIAYIYWLNLMLAGFNLLPAFPMDGGRVLRAILAAKIGFQKATRIAANLGHIFALLFAYFGITRFNLILVVIAVFIYMAASSEEAQVEVKEALKKFRIRDILPRDFLTLKPDTKLAKVLELVFHSHQEDFPVVDSGGLAGFLTRHDIMLGMHNFSSDKTVGEIMRTHFPKLKDSDTLVKAQAFMQESGLRALPVVKDGSVAGVITLEDIGRVYALISQRP